jgi:hypothetical protein
MGRLLSLPFVLFFRGIQVNTDFGGKSACRATGRPVILPPPSPVAAMQ